jgi:hypothetical protein
MILFVMTSFIAVMSTGFMIAAITAIAFFLAAIFAVCFLAATFTVLTHGLGVMAALSAHAIAIATLFHDAWEKKRKDGNHKK